MSMAVRAIRFVGLALLASVLMDPEAQAEHVKLNGVVGKIHSDVIFADTAWGRRIIGTTKDVPGIGVGDRVTILVNEDNSVIDVHKEGAPAPQHTVLAGHLVSSTPVKSEIRLWTSEGKKALPVAPSAVARFNAIPAGSPVMVELNEHGYVVDVQKMTMAANNKA